MPFLILNGLEVAGGAAKVNSHTVSRLVVTDASGNMVAAGNAITAANVLASVNGTTGSGSLVFATSPILTTPRAAIIYGGTAVSSTLILRSTTAAGTSDAIIFGVGSNGATEAMRIITDGKIGIGIAIPTAALHLAGAFRLVDGTQGINKVLTSDADGNASWQASTGGVGGSGTANRTARWSASTTLADSALYDDGVRLSVGAALQAGVMFYATHGAGSPAIQGHNSFQTTANLTGVAGTTPTAGSGYLGTFRNSIRAAVYGEQGTYSDGATNWAGYFTGRVYIGTTLTIAGGVPGVGKVLTSDANGNATWEAGGAGGSNWTVSSTDIYNSNTGNVGIGTASPQTKLHLAGTFRLVDGTQGVGKVLMSDANGNATWGTPSGSSKWTAQGTDIINSNSGLVLIHSGAKVTLGGADFSIECGDLTTIHMKAIYSSQVTQMHSNGGSVNIGSTSTQTTHRLHVTGNVYATGKIYLENVVEDTGSLQSLVWDNTTKEIKRRTITGGGASVSFAASRYSFSDCYSSGVNGNPPFTGAAISSGVSNSILATANSHFGVLILRSSTTANGGYRWQAGTAGLPLMITAGMFFRGIIQMLGNVAVGQSAIVRMGFHQSITSADALHGVYLEIEDAPQELPTPSVREFRFKTANGGVRSTSKTEVMDNSVWYHVDIEVVSLSSVRCRIWNDNLVSIMDETLTANIPTTARTLYAGIVATESSTITVNICYFDYAGFGYARPPGLEIPTLT